MAETKSTRRGGKIKDISGKPFGKLTVVAFASIRPKLGAYWLCRCECGNEKVARGADLRKGHIISCGCHKSQRTTERNTTHGMSHTPIYSRWHGMIQRCSDPNSTASANYSERGITVCERWLSFENFYADMGDPPSIYHSVERRNNDGNYEPTNCYWATRSQQARNTRQNHNITFLGKTQCLAAWAEELGFSYKMLHQRIVRYKWTVERAFASPPPSRRLG